MNVPLFLSESVFGIEGGSMEVDLVNSWESVQTQRAAGQSSDNFQL